MNNNKIEQMFLLSCRLRSDWEQVWLPIKGYKNYEISSKGRIRNITSQKVLIKRIDTKGYHRVNLYKNNKQTTCSIHRLVCNAFYPNPENKKCSDHKNNDKLNNNVNNLRWATHSENNMNSSIQCNNTSGIVGVSFHKTSKKWG